MKFCLAVSEKLGWQKKNIIPYATGYDKWMNEWRSEWSNKWMS